jgi:polyphosphate:AMP phosphotransferase
VRELRDQLLDAQSAMMRQADVGLLVLATGLPAAGRTETLAELIDWLDPKGVTTHAFRDPRRRDRDQSPHWRWWPAVPARGRISVVFGGWYEDLARRVLRRELSPAALRSATDRIREFEAFLAKERVVLAKLHFHLEHDEQRRRLKELAARPETAWRVTDEDRWLARRFAAVTRVARQIRALTDNTAGTWLVIDGTHEKRRARLAAQYILRRLQRIDRSARGPAPTGRAEPRPARAITLPTLAPRLALDADAYDLELERLQGRLAQLTREERFARRSLVLVFEGMDAAGKGGAIRRVTGALDPRQYRVEPTGAPTPTELGYPYLWRFVARQPEAGQVVIFDRSWYGRVLVERVCGYCTPADWRRAYGELVDFEADLARLGAIVSKFWLSVSFATQLKRLRERETDSVKRFKLDPRDWQNRRLWPQYQHAAAEMLKRTDRSAAPWHLVPADDKRYARLAVLRAIVTDLERGLGKV